MMKDGKVYIKKRKYPEWLTMFVLLFPFTFGTFIEFLGLPSMIKYVVDVAWIILTVVMLLQRNVVLNKKKIFFFSIIGIFFFYTLIVYLCKFQSPFYYLWGFRNNFRLYVAFFAFSTFMTEEDAFGCLKTIDNIFWINFIVCVVQFLMGYKQDHLGGIFGVEKGCNGYLIIFLSIVVIKSILSFMIGKEKVFACSLKCAISLVNAAMAELKFFFIIFIVVLALATVITAFSWRKFVVLLIGAIFIMFGSSLLVVWFGFDGIVSVEKLVEMVTNSNYATAEDLGRLTAIPTLSRTVLTEFSEQLFGLGLGNCDTSSFAICNTPFYRMYEALHYSWFSSAFLYLEIGYIGLMIYISFFVGVFVFAYKRMKDNEGELLFNQMAMIMSVLCLLLVIYNSSLRTEAAYMVYFILALPLISLKKCV